MGFRPAVSQMAGAIVAWTILGPTARRAGWAPGPVGSSKDGPQGWLVWIALATIFSESMSSLLVLLVTHVRARRASRLAGDASQDTAHPKAMVPPSMWAPGLSVSVVVCSIVCGLLFRMEWYEPVVGVALAMLVFLHPAPCTLHPAPAMSTIH